MELQQLKTFHTIVTQGSFSKASKELGYTQAAVTIQIRHLEEELGSKLFDRLGRSISLTSNGKIFYAHTLKILNDLEDAKESIVSKNEIKGQLRIGTIDSLCTTSLDHLLTRYHHAYPHVSLSITTDSIEGLLDKMLKNEIDLAYLVDQRIDDPRFTKVFEKEEKARFAVRCEHELLTHKNMTLKDIMACPLILTESNASYRTLLDADMKNRGLSIQPIIEAENTDLIMRLVNNSDSVTFLPEYLIASHLIPLPIDYHVTIYRQVIHHKDKWLSASMKYFFHMLKEDCQ